MLEVILSVGSGSARNVQIDSTKQGVLEIEALDLSGDFPGRRTFHQGKGEFACRDGAITLAPSTNVELAARVAGAGGDRTSLVLSKAADGALIIEEQVIAGGVVMFVFPIGAYKRSWYRFPPASASEGGSMPGIDLPATR